MLAFLVSHPPSRKKGFFQVCLHTSFSKTNGKEFFYMFYKPKITCAKDEYIIHKEKVRKRKPRDD
jgi:hypothetical protein